MSSTPRRQRTMSTLLGVFLSFNVFIQSSAGQDPNFMPGPSEQMKQFNWMVGEWELRPSMIIDGETVVMPTTTSTIIAILDGCMLQETTESAGSPGMKMVCIRSYDKFRKTFRNIWFDNAMGLADVYEGEMNDEGILVSTNVASGTSVPIPEEGFVHVRKKLVRADESEFRIDYETSSDNGRTWSHTGSLKYVRLDKADE